MGPGYPRSSEALNAKMKLQPAVSPRTKMWSLFKTYKYFKVEAVLLHDGKVIIFNHKADKDNSDFSI